MTASLIGYRLVLDDAWREQLVRLRDLGRCTALWRHADGNRAPCRKDATGVVWLHRLLDVRDLASWAASCDVHMGDTTHRPRTRAAIE